MRFGFLDFAPEGQTHIKVLNKLGERAVSIPLDRLKKIVFLNETEIMLVYYENHKYNYIIPEETRDEVMKIFGG